MTYDAALADHGAIPAAVKSQAKWGAVLLIVAEGEGFEPSRRCYRLRDFQSRALGQAMRPFQIGYRLSALGGRSLIVLTD
jgi:hypothetical protein